MRPRRPGPRSRSWCRCSPAVQVVRVGVPGRTYSASPASPGPTVPDRTGPGRPSTAGVTAVLRTAIGLGARGARRPERLGRPPGTPPAVVGRLRFGSSGYSGPENVVLLWWLAKAALLRIPRGARSALHVPAHLKGLAAPRALAAHCTVRRRAPRRRDLPAGARRSACAGPGWSTACTRPGACRCGRHRGPRSTGLSSLHLENFCLPRPPSAAGRVPARLHSAAEQVVRGSSQLVGYAQQLAAQRLAVSFLRGPGEPGR